MQFVDIIVGPHKIIMDNCLLSGESLQRKKAKSTYSSVIIYPSSSSEFKTKQNKTENIILPLVKQANGFGAFF